MSQPQPDRASGSDRSLLLLDACALINLYACGHIVEILSTSPDKFGMVTQVQSEALFVRRGGDGPDARDRVPIDLSDVRSSGLLVLVLEADDDELTTFIDVTVQLGDGEAMTAAIAVHRGHTVVTDDRVALRVIDGRVPTVASLDPIKQWVDRENVPQEIARQALFDLRQRGSYTPGMSHPLRSWWEELVDSVK